MKLCPRGCISISDRTWVYCPICGSILEDNLAVSDIPKWYHSYVNGIRRFTVQDGKL